MASAAPGRQPGWARRNKAPLLAGACVAAAAGYLAYRAYHSKGLASTQATLARAAETLQRLAGAAGAAGDVLEQVATDLRAFLASDTNEVPRSLRQLAKLAACPEVQDAITACAGAAARGAAGPATEAALALTDRLLEAVLSDRGSNLVALAVSVAAREGTSSLVTALREAVLGALAPGSGVASGVGSGSGSGSVARSRLAAVPAPAPHAAAAAAAAIPQQRQQQQQQPLAGAAGAAVLGALSLLQSPRGERLMRTVISTGVGSAVGACMDQAASQDLYGPLFAAFSRSEHRGALTDLAASMSGACTREMLTAVARVPPGLVVSSGARPRALGGSGRLKAAGAAVSGSSTGEDESSGGEAEAGASGSGAAAASSPERSAPSTPQSGPSTPEPSLANAQLAPRRGAGALQLRLPRALHHAAARSAPALGAAATGANADAAAAAATALEAGPVGWVVAFFVHATRHPEIRSLVLEMSCSSTREFVRTLLPFSWTTGARSGGGGSAAPGWLERLAPGAAGPEDALRAQVHRLQVTMSVLAMLVLYALSPKLMLPASLAA
jgi:hypothetical protein